MNRPPLRQLLEIITAHGLIGAAISAYAGGPLALTAGLAAVGGIALATLVARREGPATETGNPEETATERVRLPEHWAAQHNGLISLLPVGAAGAVAIMTDRPMTTAVAMAISILALFNNMHETEVRWRKITDSGPFCNFLWRDHAMGNAAATVVCAGAALQSSQLAPGAIIAAAILTAALVGGTLALTAGRQPEPGRPNPFDRMVRVDEPTAQQKLASLARFAITPRGAAIIGALAIATAAGAVCATTYTQWLDRLLPA